MQSLKKFAACALLFYNVYKEGYSQFDELDAARTTPSSFLHFFCGVHSTAESDNRGIFVEQENPLMSHLRMTDGSFILSHEKLAHPQAASKASLDMPLPRNI